MSIRENDPRLDRSTKCRPCTVPAHTAAACTNNHRPICDQTCTCRCDRPEPDPAPYWSQLTRPASTHDVAAEAAARAAAGRRA